MPHFCLKTLTCGSMLQCTDLGKQHVKIFFKFPSVEITYVKSQARDGQLHETGMVVSTCSKVSTSWFEFDKGTLILVIFSEPFFSI